MLDVYDFLDELSRSSSTVEKYEIYKKWNLKNCRLFLFNEENSGFIQETSNFPSGNFELVSLGDYSKTWVIDENTTKSSKSNIPLSRSVYYDLNILTYINKVFRGRTITRQKEFLSFLNFIKDKGFVNNIASSLLERHSNKVDKVILGESIESFVNFDALPITEFIEGKIQTLSSEDYSWMKRIWEECEKISNGFQEDKQYTAISCYLMKAFIIKHSKGSREVKIKKFLDYCLNSLYIVMEFELVLLLLYITNNTSTSRVFSKLQLGAKDLIKNMDNVAWDLYHIRLMEKYFCFDNIGTDIVDLPYFATSDKGLIKAVKINPVKMIVLYDDNIIALRDYNLTDFLTSEQVREIRLTAPERIKNNRNINFLKEKNRLKNEIQSMIEAKKTK